MLVGGRTLVIGSRPDFIKRSHLQASEANQSLGLPATIGVPGSAISAGVNINAHIEENELTTFRPGMVLVHC